MHLFSLSLSLSLCNKHAESYWRALLLILFLSFHFVSCKKAEDPIPSTNASIQNLILKLEDKEYPIVFDDKNNAVLTFPARTKLPPTVTIQQITIAPKANTTVKQNDKLSIINSQITFSVTAEDGITDSKYTIAFAVKAISGATLSSLKLNIDGNQYIPNFNSGTTATITLPEGSTIPKTVTITEIESSEGTTSSVNASESLDVVNNKFSITITSQDGKTTNHYTIVFLVKPSTGAEIKTLTLKVNENTYTPDFNASTNVVITLVLGEDIPNEATVTSLSLSEGAEASVKKDDKLAIKNDQVSIVVTSEDEKMTNTYTLSFIAQKLLRFDTDEGSAIPDIIVPKGQMVTEPTKPNKEGFFFEGWFTDEMTTIPFDFNTPITKNITLYAKWMPPYTLKLEQGSVFSTIVSYDITLTIEGEDPIVISKYDKPTYTLTDYPPSTLNGKKLSVEVKAYKTGDIEVGTAEQDFDLDGDMTLLSLPLETKGFDIKAIVDYADLKAYVQDPSRTPNLWNNLILSVEFASVYETSESQWLNFGRVSGSQHTSPVEFKIAVFTNNVTGLLKSVKVRVRHTSSRFNAYLSDIITIDPKEAEGEEHVVRFTMPEKPPYTLKFEQGTVTRNIGLLSFDITLSIEGEDDPVLIRNYDDDNIYTLTNYPPAIYNGKKLSVEVKAYFSGSVVGMAEQDFDLGSDIVLTLPLEAVSN